LPRREIDLCPYQKISTENIFGAKTKTAIPRAILFLRKKEKKKKKKRKVNNVKQIYGIKLQSPNAPCSLDAGQPSFNPCTEYKGLRINKLEPWPWEIKYIFQKLAFPLEFGTDIWLFSTFDCNHHGV
jgi:hypothetical protein